MNQELPVSLSIQALLECESKHREYRENFLLDGNLNKMPEMVLTQCIQDRSTISSHTTYYSHRSCLIVEKKECQVIKLHLQCNNRKRSRQDIEEEYRNGRNTLLRP